MRTACMLVALLLGLSACSEDDQRYLLTYQHPKAASPPFAASAPPQPTRDTATVSPTEALPASAPTQPVSVAPEVPSGTPRAVENPAPASDAISTAEGGPGTIPSPVVPVSPVETAPAQSVQPPALQPTSAPTSNPRIVPEQSPPAANLPLPTPKLPPHVVVLKHPSTGGVVPVPSPAPRQVQRAVPSMVRPAPPPPDSAAAPSTSPAPVQTTTATAASTAAAASAVPATVSQPAYSEGDAAHCKAVADQRALDAVSNGYDSDMEHQIFAGTYQNCMSWAAQHR